jgi:hypothetical protein
VGLLHSKLKEFLDLKQWNHIVFDYTQQFNTLAQYGSYHIDTDEKEANLSKVPHGVYPILRTAPPTSIAILGQSLAEPTMIILAATTTIAVQPCSYSTTIGCRKAPLVGSR